MLCTLAILSHELNDYMSFSGSSSLDTIILPFKLVTAYSRGL